jgi:hypothetical protein
MVAFEGPLDVHYGQAYVVSGEGEGTEDMDKCFRGQSHGLLGAAAPGMLFLITGLHTGHVDFTAEVADGEPPLDESWEECVEAGFHPAGSKVLLVDWQGSLAVELPLSERDYRVRYVARGMDAAHEADTIMGDEDSIDAYRLSFWPGPPAPGRVLKQSSEIARYWHEYARGLS